MSDENDPLVYSCSGCSSAAQMANDVAVRLDREGMAEMSCIAGVGGDVEPLVATAMSGRDVLVIDGCPLECARSCLDRHDVEPDRHVQLAEHDVPKQYHEDYDEQRADAIYAAVAEMTAELRGSEGESARLSN